MYAKNPYLHSLIMCIEFFHAVIVNNSLVPNPPSLATLATTGRSWEVWGRGYVNNIRMENYVLVYMHGICS